MSGRSLQEAIDTFLVFNKVFAVGDVSYGACLICSSCVTTEDFTRYESTQLHRSEMLDASL